MISRTRSLLTLSTVAAGLVAAGFSLALADDDESKLHKTMEQVGAKNSIVMKNIRTAAVFQKNQKDVVEAAKALAQLGKDVRDETEPAKTEKKPQDDWTKLMDAYIKECETFAEEAGKEGAKQADIKKAYSKGVSASCTACHEVFRKED